MVETIVLVELVIAAVACNVYPLVYAFRPWRATNAGRALMVKAIGNVILVDLSVALVIFGPEYFGRDLARIVGLGFFATGVWYLLIVLLRTPRQPRD